ncbi:MAG: hypothetical protein R3245_10905, partial [Kiloniellales bacterium]|nr:hypothetical protein [Kiloniellales bacterium]
MTVLFEHVKLSHPGKSGTEPLRLGRSEIIPEDRLPDAAAIVERGRDRAAAVSVTPSRFLRESGFGSEADYKKAAMAERRLMFHAQIGFRSLEKSKRAWRSISETVGEAGGRLDRYGICLDWSMGYPESERDDRPKGTGLILTNDEDWRSLTEEAPVAPHFGDFVLGMPSAMENSLAALAAGATTIGNLGQYFTFRLPGWDDDIGVTEATLEAIALLAARKEGILIHSNLDDGFAALFCDL